MADELYPGVKPEIKDGQPPIRTSRRFVTRLLLDNPLTWDEVRASDAALEDLRTAPTTNELLGEGGTA